MRHAPSRTCVLLIALVSSVGIAGKAGSDRTEPAASPSARSATVDPSLRRLRTDVAIDVDGAARVARFQVQEEFRNDGHGVREADYLYPVPAGAVLTEVALFAGEQRLEGEVLEADAARRIYEEIVRRRRDPALVEMAGADLIRARVFPIEPGQTRRIVLRYVQVLPADAGVVRLRYPVAAGLMSPTAAPPETWSTMREPAPREPAALTLRLHVRGASRFGTPFSPTHRIRVDRRPDDSVSVAVETPRTGADFELLLPLAEARVGLHMLTHSPDPDGEAGYFLMLLTPPARPIGEAIPRDVTLVLDVSGSMSGHKLEQARSALVRVLDTLGPRDRFRLISFSSVVRGFRSEPLPATGEHLEAARAWLRRLQADGNTNIHDALAEALEPATTPERLSLVVFLTDGLPTVSEDDPERIAAAAERWSDGERVFAFGVGADVNTYLLERLAEGGRGASTYVRPDEDVEGAVASMARKLGAPVMSDLRIAASPAELEEIYPSRLPDLFAGEELVVVGRYRGEGSGPLVVEGARPDGRARVEHRIELPHRQADNGFVARLWAARKAGALTTRMRLYGPDPESVEALRQLGLRYGILTEYTSYLVQEPELSVARERRLIQESFDASAPPAAQTGDVAFRRARASSRLGAASSMAEAEATLADTAVPVADRPGWRQAAGRLFVMREGTWQDAAVDGDIPALTVSPYGPAWFRVLERLPGLRPALALGERVKIAGAGLVLAVSPDGRARLGDGEWARLLAAFPGETS